jgi:hypothetical protein
MMPPRSPDASATDRADSHCAASMSVIGDKADVGQTFQRDAQDPQRTCSFQFSPQHLVFGKGLVLPSVHPQQNPHDATDTHRRADNSHRPKEDKHSVCEKSLAQNLA